MAGRGRGGGGGRGRGRGSMSFNLEELGFSAGEALPGPVLQPPPLYPPMERTPVPLKSGSEVGYLLALKRDLVEHFKYSPAFLVPAAKVKDIERYSDSKSVESTSNSSTLSYDWKRFPAELRPVNSIAKTKRPNVTNGKSASKKVRFADVENKLAELEKQEEQSDTEEKSEENKDTEKEGEEQQDEEVEEEDQDEEMDDGTDYVNDYFDNGESYLDEEDDNLDDGPVY